MVVVSTFCWPFICCLLWSACSVLLFFKLACNSLFRIWVLFVCVCVCMYIHIYFPWVLSGLNHFPLCILSFQSWWPFFFWWMEIANFNEINLFLITLFCELLKKSLLRLRIWRWFLMLPSMCAQLLQLCATLCYTVDLSRSGSSSMGFFQARILEWVAFACSTHVIIQKFYFYFLHLSCTTYSKL